MKRRLSLLIVAAMAASAGCGDATAAGATEQFTQGGVSMEPTVRAGQVITVRDVAGEYEPRRGDIVLFRAGGGNGGDTRTAPLLKRVVAVGGETVACFVMGDNRASSNDSRCDGPVPASSVTAVMIS